MSHDDLLNIAKHIFGEDIIASINGEFTGTGKNMDAIDLDPGYVDITFKNGNVVTFYTSEWGAIKKRTL